MFSIAIMVLGVFLLFILLFAHGIATNCPSVTIFGAGSSFPAELYNYAAGKYESYRNLHGISVRISYMAVNSGYGKNRIVTQNEMPRIQFAGTESLLDREVQKLHADLLSIPILAGALSIPYYLPTVPDLTLHYSVLSKIYTGEIRKWNDMRIQATNPMFKLPNEQILPIARSDNGGDTEIFTSALCSFDQEWNRTYKSFIDPRFANGICCKDSLSWPNNSIHLFGKRTLGMLGIVSSIPNSIGYAAAPNVKKAGMESAKLIDFMGNITGPTLTSVHKAIDYHIEANPGDYYFGLYNAKVPGAYPIATFSYVIINASKSLETSCCEVRELVGFLDFVSRMEPEPFARLDLVSITEYGRKAVIQPYLEKVVCGGQNMYDEYRLSTKPAKPLYVTPIVVIASAMLALLGVVMIPSCIYQRRQAQKMQESMWLIPHDTITLVSAQKGSRSLTSLTLNKGRDLLGQGILYDEPVMIVDLNLGNPKKLDPQSKALLRQGLEKIRSEYVLGLRGLTTLQGQTKIIYAYPARGFVHSVLKETRMKLYPQIRVEIAKNAVKGLQFLHRNGIVHGTISSVNTFFDQNWTVKYADWLNYSLAKIENGQVATAMLNSICDQDPADEIAAVQMIYLDPRAKARGTIADESTDIFSVSLLIMEIINTTCPYLEEMNRDTLKKFLEEKFKKITVTRYPEMGIVHESLRPKLRSCIKRDADPFTIQGLLKTLDQISPNTQGIVHLIMTSMEEYLQHLEEKIADRNEARGKGEQSEVFNNSSTAYITSSRNLLPPSVRQRIANGSTLAPEYFESASVLAIQCNDLATTMYGATIGLNKLLTDMTSIERVIEEIAKEYDAILLPSCGEVFVICSGALERNGADHAHILVRMAEQLMYTVKERHMSSVFRAGISTGPVAAGIIGKMFPKYCVLGEAVAEAIKLSSIANRMEILVSRGTKDILEHTNGPNDFCLETVKLCGITDKTKNCFRLYGNAGFGREGASKMPKTALTKK